MNLRTFQTDSYIYIYNILNNRPLSNVAASGAVDHGLQSGGAKVSGPSTARSDTAEMTSPSRPQGPNLVLLTGLPGLGKDLICECLQATYTEFKFDWVFLSDDLHCQYPNEAAVHTCYDAVQEALMCGQSVMLKSNSFNQEDRAPVLQLATRLGCPTLAIVPSELHPRKSVKLLQACVSSAVAPLGLDAHPETLNAVEQYCSSIFALFSTPAEDEISSVSFLSFLDDEADKVLISAGDALDSELKAFVPFSAQSLSFSKPSKQDNGLEDAATDEKVGSGSSEVSSPKKPSAPTCHRRCVDEIAQDIWNILFQKGVFG